MALLIYAHNFDLLLQTRPLTSRNPVQSWTGNCCCRQVPIALYLVPPMMKYRSTASRRQRKLQNQVAWNVIASQVLFVLWFCFTIGSNRSLQLQRSLVGHPSPGTKRKVVPPVRVSNGPSLPTVTVPSAVVTETDGKVPQQLLKLINAVMRKLIDLSQAVSRTEEKVDRLLESQDARLVEEALEDVVDFPIHEKDGLTLLEDILKTGNNKVKLVSKFLLMLELLLVT